jgi:hypothetical protein
MSYPAAGRLPDEYDPVAIGLEGRRVSWDVAAMPLKDLIEQLGTRYAASVMLDSQIMDRIYSRFDETTMVSLKVQNATLAEAVWAIHTVEDEETSLAGLTYRVVGETIVIGEKDYMGRGAVLRAYDVKPLVAKLVPHQRALDKLLPEPKHRGTETFMSNPRDEEFDFDLFDRVEGVMYLIAADAIVENRSPTFRAGGVIFVEATRDKHQEIARRLNEILAELDRIGAPAQ